MIYVKIGIMNKTLRKETLEFIELNNTDFEYGKKIRQSRFNQAMKNFK